MKRKLTAITLLLVSLLSTVPIYAKEVFVTPTSSYAIPTKTNIDTRVRKLENYLEKHNSPLAPFAHVFVKKADQYGLPDWRLVPAITGVESTFGKHIPYHSYNAYGWANGNHSFINWEESIDVVTRTLKEKYYDKGRNTIEKIGHTYAPPSTTWAGKVHFFMNAIENHKMAQHEIIIFTL